MESQSAAAEQFLGWTAEDFGIGTLFNVLRDAVIVANAGDGRIVLWNPAASQLFGYTEDEALSLPLEALVPERLRDRHRAGIAGYASTGRGALIDSGKPVELPGVRKDGSEVFVELSLTPIGSPQANTRYALAIIRDASERKEAEFKLLEALELEKAASEQARSLDEMKNAFLNAISHEFRTSLAVILGFAITLDRSDVAPMGIEERKKITSRLVAASEKLDRLFRDLLDVDRLSRGLGEVHRTPTDVGDLVRSLWRELDMTSRTIEIQAEDGVAMIDGPKVRRIVENLIANAVHHTPEGTLITLSVKYEENEVLIVVEDDGPGIPKGAAETIFEPFARGQLSDPNPGTGIGLSLVLSFAKLHGGTAWVEDRPQGGASFRVRLPTS